ncbi:unnamed protein product, partial [marine sediment metagenome]
SGINKCSNIKEQITLLKKRLENCDIIEGFTEVIYNESNLRYDRKRELEGQLTNESLTPSERADILFNIGKLDYRHWDYSEALKNFEENLTINKQLKNSFWIDRCLWWIGTIYCALKNFERALEIFERLGVKNNLQEILGIIRYVQDSSEDLFPLHFRYLLRWTREELTNPGTSLPDVAMRQHSLGALYNSFENFKEAETAYTGALDIYRDLAAENPDTYLPDVAKTHNELGKVYLKLNRFEEGEQQYREALD